MTDWAQSGRIDKYRATLVDPFTLKDVRDLDFIPEESNITWGYDTDNWYSGSIAIREDLGDQSRYLVRIYHYTKVDDYDKEIELATMFIASTNTEFKYGVARTTLNCYSTLYRLADDVLTKEWNLTKNTYYFANHVATLLGKGRNGYKWDYRKESDVSDKKLTKNDSYEGQTSVREVLTAIAGKCNSYILVNGHGTIIFRKYVAPSKRAISFTFNDKNSLYVPGFKYDDGRDNVYNGVVVWYSNSKGKDYAWYGIADTNPYSFKNTGRYVTKVLKLEGDKKYSRTEMKNAANKFMDNNKKADKYIEIEHVGIPTLQVGQVVKYVNNIDTVAQDARYLNKKTSEWKCLVWEISMDLVPGAKCSTRLKVVT